MSVLQNYQCMKEFKKELIIKKLNFVSTFIIITNTNQQLNMDFTAYASTGSTGSTSATPPIKTPEKKGTNYDHYTDPYIRRYHIIKIGLQSLSIGLMGYLTKLTIQNIRNRKFCRLSPWLELCIIGGAFSYGLDQKFGIQKIHEQQLKALSKFKQTHYFNSQYWH